MGRENSNRELIQALVIVVIQPATHNQESSASSNQQCEGREKPGQFAAPGLLFIIRNSISRRIVIGYGGLFNLNLG